MRVDWLRVALLATTCFGSAAPALAQITPGDQTGTAEAAGNGQSAASSTNAPAVSARDAGEGDIIVTARRVEERLQDVPISITVFNQQQLLNRNVVTASDLGTYTPSLSSNSRFGPDNSSFAIRGFTQEIGTSPSVAVYFADVVAPRGGQATTSGDGAGPGSFFDLANVQVLKGPQGTLFGRNTTGGAVLLVPQKPTSRLEGYIEGSVGNYDLRRVQAVLNTPISGSARLRLGIDRETRDGYLHNRSGIGPGDFSDIDYFAARASLVVDLTPDLENYSIGTFSRSDTNGTLARLIACNPNVSGLFVVGQAACQQLARQAARGDGYYDVEANLNNPRTLTKQFQFINTTTWQASDTLTVKNIASYAEFTQNFRSSVFGENLFFPAVVNVPVTATVSLPVPTGPLAGRPFTFTLASPFPGLHSAAERTVTEELQLQGRTADDRLVYQVGGYFEHATPLGFSGSGGGDGAGGTLISCTNATNLQCTDVIGAFLGGLSRSQVLVGSVGSRIAQTTFRNLAGYAQATYKITDQLSATGGIRYTSDRTTGIGEQVSHQFPAPNTPTSFCSNTLVFGRTANVTEANCRVRYQQKSARPTWLADIDFKPTEDILIYAKYARGYRQGNVNVFAPGFETYGPEKVNSYEAGAKTSFHGAVSGTFNVAGFYNDLYNQQLQANAVAATTSGVANTNAVVNAGRSRIWGIEADTSLRLFRGFTLDASYTFLNSKLKSITPPILPPGSPFQRIELTAVAGGRLTFSPKNKVTVTGTYQLPLDENIGRIAVGATFTHTDRQIFTVASPFGTLPATDLVNLNLNWNSVLRSPVDLSLFVTNLTKEKYPIVIGGAFSSVGFESIVPGEPRMFGARLRLRFGN